MSLPVTQNTSDCFDDLISLKGVCNNITPTSGVFIDSYGMSLNEINKYISEEYENGSELFIEKKNAAIEIISNIVLTELNPQVKATSLIENYRVGFYDDNLQIISPEGPNKGMKITLNNNASYLNFFLSSISLQLNYTGQVNVYLADLKQNKIIETFIVDVFPNEVTTIYPQYTLPSNKEPKSLFLFYNTVGKPSYKATVVNNGCGDCYPTNRNGLVEISGATLADGVQKILSNLTTVTDTGGMSITYNLSCNYKMWLCSISNLIAIPLAFKTIAEILNYAINTPTDRLNNGNIIDRDRLEKRYLENESKFQHSLDRVMRNIRLTDHNCFECNRSVYNKISLP